MSSSENSSGTPPSNPATSVYREVIGGLKDAADPLEFIRTNLRVPDREALNGSQIVPRPSATPAPTPPPVTTPVASGTSFKDAELGLELPLESTKPKAPEVAPEAALPPAEEPTPEEAAKGPEESIKNLRKKTNELKNQLEDKEKSLGELKEELERYARGEVIPEVLKEKEDRISQLEYYERLHALRLSPEFQKKYVEPNNELKNKALKIAEEYQVGPEVLNEAFGIESKRDLNAFLSNHFDDVGALEIRNILLDMRKINEEAEIAEQEPKAAFENLQEEYARQQERQEKVRIATIVANSREGWIEALQEVNTNEEFPELMYLEDEEHNKFVRPIIESAAQEYGKFVKLLEALGAKNLPKDAAKMLAKRFQLSQASSVIARSRADHYNKSQEIIEETKRQAPFIRPPVGGATVGGGAPPQKKSMTAKEAAESLLDKVMRK